MLRLCAERSTCHFDGAIGTQLPRPDSCRLFSRHDREIYTVEMKRSMGRRQSISHSVHKIDGSVMCHRRQGRYLEPQKADLVFVSERIVGWASRTRSNGACERPARGFLAGRRARPSKWSSSGLYIVVLARTRSECNNGTVEVILLCRVDFT